MRGRMESYIIYLPFPPSVNSAYSGKARRHKSQEYKAWQSHVYIYLNRQGAVRGINELLTVTIDLFAPDKRIRDAANYEKCAIDTLVSYGVLADDALIIDSRQRWMERDASVPDWAGCMVHLQVVRNRPHLNWIKDKIRGKRSVKTR